MSWYERYSVLSMIIIVFIHRRRDRGSPAYRLQHGGGEAFDLVEARLCRPVLLDAAVGGDDVEVRLDPQRPHLLHPAAVATPVQHQDAVGMPDRILQRCRGAGCRDAAFNRPAGALEEPRPGLCGQFSGVRNPGAGDDGDRHSVTPQCRVNPASNLVPYPPDTVHDLLVGAGKT